MLSGRIENWNPNDASWLEKYQINLDADIFVARDSGERNALTWLNNLLDLMLQANCGLEVSETVLTEQRKILKRLKK